MNGKKEVEIRICDFCEKSDQCYYKCDCCGKDVCFDCRDNVGVQYEHSMCCSGTGDGFYCHACDASDKSDLHTAFVRIRSLRLEAQAFYEGHRTRSDEAEKRLKEIQAR